MSTYAFCLECDAPLRSPTLVDVIVGSIECSKCDELYRIDDSERRTFAEIHLEEDDT